MGASSRKKAVTTVTVNILHPSRGQRMSHWAIWLKRSRHQSVLLQVGQNSPVSGYHVHRPIYRAPGKRETLKNLHVTKIPDDLYDEVVDVIQNTPVKDEEDDWNCQRWVMDAIDELERRGLISVDAMVKEILLSSMDEREL